jgi:hypothetical protein
MCQGCTAFLWYETNSFLCLYHFWPSTRRFSDCECSPPSPLKFVMDCSGMWRILTHFLFVFVCRRWVHPVSVTMRAPLSNSFDLFVYQVLLTHFGVAKKKNCTGGRLGFWIVRKFPLHFFYSCLSSWTQGCTSFLWYETNSFLCLYHFWPSTRRFSDCECSPPSPLKFVMDCSGMQGMLTVCVCTSSGNTEPADDFDSGWVFSFLCLSLFLFFFCPYIM